MKQQHYINQQWVQGNGPAFTSTDSADSSQVWQGNGASAEQVDQAITSARQAFPAWA